MIDCGFGLEETQSRLAKLEVQPEELDAILVTHEHQDHISGVESLAARFDLPVFMTEGTARVWRSRGRVTPNLIRCSSPFQIGDIEVLAVSVPHDAREPVQYVISYSDHKVGVLTDLGSLTKHIFDAYKDCHTILIEANHDLSMLQNGPYPASLKRRVSGNWGHLNNLQTAGFLQQLFGAGKLNQVIVGHISEQNNRVDLVREQLESQPELLGKVIFATQEKPLNWVDL